MKTIPAAVQTVVDANIGTHPYTTVTIVWDSGEVTYTDNNKILGAGQAVSDVKLGMVSAVQNISITLDDTDGTLKQKYNQEIIEGKTCIVKQNYDGVVGDVVVLRGKIIGDIVWSEGERQLSFNVESILHSDDIGFAPDEDDGVADSAVGVPWPIVFGSVAHSRAVKVISSPDMYISECVTISSRSFRVRVDGGGLPPQGAQIIRVDGIRFSGTFDGNIFTVLSSQLPTYTNVSLANPPANFPTDTRVAWLRDDGIFLQGLRCKLTLTTHPSGTQFQLNKCIKQEGKKCIFESPWTIQLNSSHSFDLVGRTLTWGDSHHRTIVYGPYQVQPGTQAFLEGADEDLYVANLFPSAEVRSVFAYKTIGGERRFAPVPSNYYTVNKSQSLLGNTVTAIEFYYPLRSMLDEGWDDTIYVSLRSSLSNNLSRVIHWLMDNYTNAGIDATSFETVRSQVTPFPVNFTLYDRPSALTIAERIAYLGRCALTIRDNTAYLKYLSYAHAADYDLTEAVTEYKSIRMSCTLTENIYTRTVAKYRLDYSGREPDRDIIYENNVSTFGLQEKEIDFFIYNSRRLVYNSLSYWGYLYSNSWRELTISNFLKTIALDGYDVASVDIPSVSANELKGYVINTSHNSDVHSIQTKILLDSRMGLTDISDEPESDPRFWRYDDDPTPDESIPDDPIEDLDDCEPSDTYVPPTRESDPVDDDEEETEYFYKVTGATSWQRASERSLTVTVVDSSGAQVSSNGTAMLSLTNKTNLLDRLNQDTRAISSISISNGQWNYNQMTITGGSGDATATIMCRGAQVIDGRLQRVHPGHMDISITDKELDQDDPGGPGTYDQRRLTWTTHPPSVVDRGQTFTIGLKYGPSGGSLRCYLVSTDGNDRLVSESGAAVTSLAFDTDPDCTHTSTVKVVGGSGEDQAVITVISRFGRQVNSQEFTIKEEEEDEEEIVDVEDGDDNWYLGPLSLTMTKSGRYDQESFALTVSLVDGAGDPVPGIDGFVFINVTDGDMSFEDIGPNGYLVSGQQAVVKLVDGTWSYADTKMSIGDPAFPQCLTAYYEDEDTGGFLYSENVCDDGEALELILTRAVSVFDATTKITVEIVGANTGERVTSFSDDVALDITSANATFTDLGPSATILGANTATVAVVDGIWEFATCTIDTSAATEDVCIEASYGTEYGTTITDSFCDSGIHAPSTSFTSRYGFNDGLSAPGPTGVKWNFEDAYIAVNAASRISGMFVTVGVSGALITREGIGQFYVDSVNNWRVDLRCAISFHNYAFPTSTGLFNAIELNIELANTSAGKVVIVPTTSATHISLDAALASSDVRIFDVQAGRKIYSITPLDMSAYNNLQVFPVFETTRDAWTTPPLKEALTRTELINSARTIRINPSDTSIVLRYQ